MGIPEDLKKMKHPNVEIRRMEIDDFATVFHLGETLFKAEKVPNLYRTWDEFEVISMYQADPEICLVAESDDHIVGFAMGTTISKSHSAWKYGHLVWLGVEPAFQRQNIARRLFNRFRDLAMEAGVRMLLVDTEADNLPAIRFFQKMGFGNPEQHMYLTLNVASQRREYQEKMNHRQQQNRRPGKNHG